MEGKRVVCPQCGFFCAIKREDGRVLCMGNGSCRYDSKKDSSKKKLDIRQK